MWKKIRRASSGPGPEVLPNLLCSHFLHQLSDCRALQSSRQSYKMGGTWVAESLHSMPPPEYLQWTVMWAGDKCLSFWVTDIVGLFVTAVSLYWEYFHEHREVRQSAQGHRVSKKGSRFESKWFVFRNHVINCYSMISPFHEFIFLIHNKPLPYLIYYIWGR